MFQPSAQEVAQWNHSSNSAFPAPDGQSFVFQELTDSQNQSLPYCEKGQKLALYLSCLICPALLLLPNRYNFKNIIHQGKNIILYSLDEFLGRGENMRKFMMLLILFFILPIWNEYVEAEEIAEIKACYQKKSGKLRRVKSESECLPSEEYIVWATEGPQGPPGPPGPTGPQVYVKIVTVSHHRLLLTMHQILQIISRKKLPLHCLMTLNSLI